MQHNRKSIWITLFCAIIFTYIMGVIFPKNTEKYLRGYFWIKKTYAPSKFDMIVLGDSRIYRGVAVKPMEDILTDFKILNFGYSSGGLNPEIYEVGAQKLNPKSKTKVLLLGITAFSLTPMSKKNAHYLGEKNRKKEDVYEKLYLDKSLNWFSPVTPKQIRDKIKRNKPKYLYTHDYQYGGWVASEKIPEDSTEAVKSYINTFSEGGVSEELINDLQYQIKEWTNNNINVFAFRPPVSQPMLALADTMAGYNEELIKALVKDAGGYWIDVNPYDYHTYDGSHLHRNSAINLSKDLATEIKVILQGKGIIFE